MADELLHGMDYGAPPRFLLMADPALMELWNQAKCLGIGHLAFPRGDPFFDVPVVAIIFDDLEMGMRVFKLLKSWDCEPGSGRGADISFIENRQADSYTMTIGPNYPELVRRLLDPCVLEDYSVHTSGLSVGKTLKLSEHFRWLRKQAKTKPVVFAPGDAMHGALLEHALTSANVKFFDQETVRKGTVEYAMSAGEVEPADSKGTRPLAVDPVQISTKRQRQLKRFFPIAIARLKYNPTFTGLAERLSPTHERWQLEQAACNILCGERFPELRTADGKINFRKAYKGLRRKPEEVIDSRPLHQVFKQAMMEAQIAEDVRYLCHQVRPNSGFVDPVVALRALGLLQ